MTQRHSDSYAKKSFEPQLTENKYPREVNAQVGAKFMLTRRRLMETSSISGIMALLGPHWSPPSLSATMFGHNWVMLDVQKFGISRPI